MPTVTLPSDPGLEHLRKLARRLQRAVRTGDEHGLALVTAHHPDGAPAHPAGFKLSAAQLVVARAHGFPSWPAVVRYFEVVGAYRWDPAEPATDEEPAGRFLRLACLTYSAEDGPARWEAAGRLLADHPEVTGTPWGAAAAADLPAMTRLLDADPGHATRPGGPYGWCPLFYLAYSRLGPADDAPAVAALLLDAGADPGEGYLWHGLPTPFTVLTGVFGEGEQGPVHQPRHPRSLALARLLLDAGADPNDAQTLYNRQFRADDDFLEILLDHGLGTGDGGRWRRRLGDATDTPVEMLRKLLIWAAVHGQAERAARLVRAGLDPDFRDRDGRTPAELALRNGYPALAAALGGAPDADPVTSWVGAALAVDPSTLDALEAADPALPERVRAELPGLVVWASASRGAPAVDLLLDRGFDVNARGRADGPTPADWETALHAAAGDNHIALIEHLLARGADPAARDARFDATPLDWARHFGHTEAIALLERA
ncbi:ankyrin repeat domain-containing protein [Cryptosporangium sp. NPDC051539]|uniref:ankyrin repeat domain-containing protein n=1 Tax=Cryptosporangium sp. NPDC051539 TaxID=3363962 RepID=UPI0037953BE0